MATVAERLAQITDLTEVTVSTATYDELVRAFNKMSGRGVRIDRRWSERRLREEVSGMIIRETARFIREDEVAAEKAARQELLDAKKAAAMMRTSSPTPRIPPAGLGRLLRSQSPTSPGRS